MIYAAEKARRRVYHKTGIRVALGLSLEYHSGVFTAILLRGYE
jgi:hypothetical protein